jgi:putative ABC transport system ATP-binding protein
VRDFEIAAGVSLALVGASGSGKSTALMAIAGVLRPSQGNIVIDGTDLWTLTSRSRDRFRGRRIGLVFQSFHLVDALSVRDNVRLAARCAGHPVREPDRLNLLLDRLGLSETRNRRADRISHGQAQRAAVARAVINRPAVILADEPTSALDNANADALIALLTECAKSEKAALVVATHDRRVLKAVDDVVEMRALS